MVTQACTFKTRRLLIKEWHSLTPDECKIQDLESTVASILTPPVTKFLPPEWQGSYSTERAEQWIKERDQEGTTLLVIEQTNRSAVGLVILIELKNNISQGVELRLGYLLEEKSWGMGLATELLYGFVEWCKKNSITSVIGGVVLENSASQRVLEKVGFISDSSNDEVETAELLYRLNLNDLGAS